MKKYSAGLPLLFASEFPDAIERHLIGSFPGAVFGAPVSDRGPGTKSESRDEGREERASSDVARAS